ncbi:MAG: formylglycine-generating enzyme family protein [Pseudomonadota bacterium]
MKHDDYEYYFLNFGNEGLSQEAGATHIGMFIAWAISRDLVVERDSDDYVVWLAKVLRREVTGRDFLLHWCAGKLHSDDLNADGNAFATHSYTESYLRCYCKVFGLEGSKTADELCSVEDSWSNFDKLAPVLDELFLSKMGRAAGKRQSVEFSLVPPGPEHKPVQVRQLAKAPKRNSSMRCRKQVVPDGKCLEIFNDIEFVKIPAGEFMMGRGSNHYPVEISQSFHLGKYLVTQAQWMAIMDSNPSLFDGDDLPVECVSWLAVQKFIVRLNAKTGLAYRLPTEAQWEYACRAGTMTPYYTGMDITGDQANFDSGVGSTTPVGSYPPNPWGLYDMAGNVWEWTDSIRSSGFNGAELQGSRWNDISSERVVRGGSWFHVADPNLLSGCRDCFSPDFGFPNEQDVHIGFRLYKL